MIIDTNKIDVPQNLTGDFFQNSLQNGLRETKIILKEIIFEMGSIGGDNYCSSIYRVNITFQRNRKPDESIKVIVKSILDDESMDFLDQMDVFHRETIFYFDILPKMEILVDNTKFGAKCLYSTKIPISTFVFEDLKESGFVMANREKGLDEEHCKIVMEKLGKFHAVSMVLLKKDPSIIRHFKEGFLENLDNSSTLQTIYSQNLMALISAMKTWKGFESISKKLQKYHENYKERARECGASRDGEIKVLCHGDMWVNNFMYKYDKSNGSPIDLVFVDFQMCVYNSPGIDINYFLYTSVQLDILKYKREDLIMAYYQSMRNTLEAANFLNIPSYVEIRNEVKCREGYGCVANIGVFPIISMDKNLSQDNSLDNLSNDEASKNKMDLVFNGPRLVETMKYTLKRFDELGVLD